MKLSKNWILFQQIFEDFVEFFKVSLNFSKKSFEVFEVEKFNETSKILGKIQQKPRKILEKFNKTSKNLFYFGPIFVLFWTKF